MNYKLCFLRRAKTVSVNQERKKEGDLGKAPYPSRRHELHVLSPPNGWQAMGPYHGKRKGKKKERREKKGKKERSKVR